MRKRLHKLGRAIFHNLETVLGVILVWRGIWYLLDHIDKWAFGGSHFWTALLGVAIGLAILFIPEHDHDIEQLL